MVQTERGDREMLSHKPVSFPENENRLKLLKIIKN
jgi:hypothetical protein